MSEPTGVNDGQKNRYWLTEKGCLATGGHKMEDDICTSCGIGSDVGVVTRLSNAAVLRAIRTMVSEGFASPMTARITDYFPEGPINLAYPEHAEQMAAFKAADQAAELQSIRIVRQAILDALNYEE